MTQIGQTFSVGDAVFVVEQLGTGEVWARCVRPSLQQPAAWAPHQLYHFGEGLSDRVRLPAIAPRSRPLVPWWAVVLIAVAAFIGWWRSRRP